MSTSTSTRKKFQANAQWKWKYQVLTGMATKSKRLSRKILRKLESKNPVYVKSQSEALCNYLDDLFGTDKMPLCKEVIHNIEQNV